MEGLEYLLVEPACEVNEKGTTKKNDGNEDVRMDDNENIEWTEPDQPMTTGTRKGDRKRTGMRYNRYGDDFLIDKIQPGEVGEELVNIGDPVANEKWQIISDSEHSLQEYYSVAEREIDLEQSEIERRENINLRVLEWMHNLETGERVAQKIQQVDVSAMKHVKTGNPLFSWKATDRPLEIFG